MQSGKPTRILYRNQNLVNISQSLIFIIMVIKLKLKLTQNLINRILRTTYPKYYQKLHIIKIRLLYFEKKKK